MNIQCRGKATMKNNLQKSVAAPCKVAERVVATEVQKLRTLICFGHFVSLLHSAVKEIRNIGYAPNMTWWVTVLNALIFLRTVSWMHTLQLSNITVSAVDSHGSYWRSWECKLHLDTMTRVVLHHVYRFTSPAWPDGQWRQVRHSYRNFILIYFLKEM